MLKKYLIIIFLFTFIISGCRYENERISNNLENQNIEYEEDKIKEDRNKMISCIENELSGYLVTEQDELIDFPLSEIKDVNPDKIEYFRGTYASNHKDNMLLIIYPKNGTYEAEEMNKFINYFSNKFFKYQLFEDSMIPTIYIHTPDNNININDITNKCVDSSNSTEGKLIKDSILNNLNYTNKIIIESGNKVLGEIQNKDKIEEVLSAITSSKQYGDAFLCDGYAFDFLMYNDNKKINTIHVFYDGKRLFPEGSSKGCAYYTISNRIDLRKIIEDETDYIFYSIVDYSDTCEGALELIYEDDNYKYYLKCIKSDKVKIKFLLSSQIMPLKYALENNYISADKVASEYPDLLIKENK